MTEVQQRTAEQLFRTLGELKGGAMKFGQALSILEGALPEEIAAPYREHLTRLQDSAPPMSTRRRPPAAGPRVRRRVEAQHRRVRRHPDRGRVDRPGPPGPLGGRHRGRDQDPVPRRRAGADVRPPADHPAGKDVRRAAAGHRRPGARPGAAGPDRRGARLQPRGRGPGGVRRRVRRRPAVRGARGRRPTRKRVIVTEWLPAVSSLAKVIEGGTQEERDHWGELYARFLFEGPARTGMMHADPHPGNFRVVPGVDGAPDRLGVLDYGAVARLPERAAAAVAGTADADRAARRLRRGGHAPARRGVHQAEHPGARRGPQGLPRAVRRPGPRRRRSASPATTCAASSQRLSGPGAIPRPSWRSGSTSRRSTSSSTAPSSAASGCCASSRPRCRSGGSSTELDARASPTTSETPGLTSAPGRACPPSRAGCWRVHPSQ